MRAVAFSNDGQRVASASDDQSIIVWNVDSRQKEAVLAGHPTRVTGVAFSPDGKWLASADQDGTVMRWDVAQRSPQLTHEPPAFEPSYFVAISPDGRVVATTWTVYDIQDGHELIPYKTLWKSVYSAAFTRDQRRLVGGTNHGEIIVCETQGWQVDRQKVSDTALVSVSLSNDGRYLVTGDDRKAVRLWTIEPLRQVAVLGRHEARVKAVAFSPDDKQVASAGDDKMIALWNVSRSKLIATIGTHSSPVYAIAFSPDGQRLVSGEHDGSVRLYTRHRELWGFRLN